MEKLKRTVAGIRNMPSKARYFLGLGFLLSSMMLSLSILCHIVSEGQETPFALWKLSGQLQRLSALPLYIEIYFSLKSATQEKR